MAVIRVQSILKSTSGMVRDNAVNVWHFNGTITDANLLAIDAAVDEFYRTIIPGQARSIDQWLSTHVSKVQNKIYNVTTEPAGPPLLVSAERDLAATRMSGTNLPEEVAVALSFAGTPEAGLVQARRRGRIFLGPLRSAAVTDASSNGMQVASDFRADLLLAGQRLAVTVDPAAEWVVYSRPFAGRPETPRPGRTTLPALPARPGSTVNIDQVSVDNAPDTQRRRGLRPTQRYTAQTSA